MNAIDIADLQQRDLPRRAEALRAQVLEPNAACVDREARFPCDNWAALRDAGLLDVLHAPSPNGLQTFAEVAREVGRGCASTGLCFVMHVAASALLYATTNDAQRARFCGEFVATYATSEPTSGAAWWRSDMRAKIVRGGVVLNGVKSFATSANRADVFLVLARANDYASATELSLFAVERGPSVEVCGDWDAMGARGTDSAGVAFRDCFVPDANRLGEVGQGWELMLSHGFAPYLLGVSSVYVGVCEALFDATLDAVSDKRDWQGRVGREREAVQLAIGAMAAQVDSARALLQHTARGLDACAGASADEAAFLPLAISAVEMKLLACRAAREVAGAALSLCGGRAYKKPHPIERLFRDAQAGTLMGPPDEMLQILLGAFALGHPLPWLEASLVS